MANQQVTYNIMSKVRGLSEQVILFCKVRNKAITQGLYDTTHCCELVSTLRTYKIPLSCIKNKK